MRMQHESRDHIKRLKTITFSPIVFLTVSYCAREFVCLSRAKHVFYHIILLTICHKRSKLSPSLNDIYSTAEPKKGNVYLLKMSLNGLTVATNIDNVM